MKATSNEDMKATSELSKHMDPITIFIRVVVVLFILGAIGSLVYLVIWLFSEKTYTPGDVIEFKPGTYYRVTAKYEYSKDDLTVAEKDNCTLLEYKQDGTFVIHSAGCVKEISETKISMFKTPGSTTTADLLRPSCYLEKLAGTEHKWEMKDAVLPTVDVEWELVLDEPPKKSLYTKILFTPPPVPNGIPSSPVLVMEGDSKIYVSSQHPSLIYKCTISVDVKFVENEKPQIDIKNVFPETIDGKIIELVNILNLSTVVIQEVEDNKSIP